MTENLINETPVSRFNRGKDFESSDIIQVPNAIKLEVDRLKREFSCDSLFENIFFKHFFRNVGTVNYAAGTVCNRNFKFEHKPIDNTN